MEIPLLEDLLEERQGSSYWSRPKTTQQNPPSTYVKKEPQVRYSKVEVVERADPPSGNKQSLIRSPSVQFQEETRPPRKETLGAIPTPVDGSKNVRLRNFVRNKVMPRVKMRKAVGGIMDDVTKSVTKGTIGCVIMLTCFTVGMLQSRVALFNVTAAGRWNDGQPYKFSYAWCMTFLIFIAQLGIVLCKNLYRTIIISIKQSVQNRGDEAREKEEALRQAQLAHIESFKDLNCWGRLKLRCKLWRKTAIKWGLPAIQSFIELLSQSLTSWALVYGVPGTVMVVFKSSGMILKCLVDQFLVKVGVMDHTEDRKMTWRRWLGLLVLLMGLLCAAKAEAKGGGKKKKASGGGDDLPFGMCCLIVGEFLRVLVVTIAEVAREPWEDPLNFQGVVAVFGIAQTGFMLRILRWEWVEMPDGAYRPAADMKDVLVMCIGKPLLAGLMLLHILMHMFTEVTSMYSLRYISGLTQSICHVFTVMLMWVTTKLYWLLGICALLADPWQPGLRGSWLMAPAMLVILYGMMMFKSAKMHPKEMIIKLQEMSNKQANLSFDQHIFTKSQTMNDDEAVLMTGQHTATPEKHKHDHNHHHEAHDAASASRTPPHVPDVPATLCSFCHNTETAAHISLPSSLKTPMYFCSRECYDNQIYQDVSIEMASMGEQTPEGFLIRELFRGTEPEDQSSASPEMQVNVHVSDQDDCDAQGNAGSPEEMEAASSAMSGSEYYSTTPGVAPQQVPEAWQSKSKESDFRHEEIAAEASHDKPQTFVPRTASVELHGLEAVPGLPQLLLGLSLPAATVDEVLRWCAKNGITSLKDVIDKEMEDALVDATGLASWMKRLLLERMEQQRNMRRLCHSPEQEWNDS